MKSLGDDVCISSIHGGGEECMVAVSTTNGLWFLKRNLGGTPPDPLLSQSRLPEIEPSLTVHDQRPLVMRHKFASRNFGPGGPCSVTANCVDFCILHPLVVVGFLPHLHKSIITSRY